MTSAGQRRSRRGGEEIRALLLQSARELFAAQGYAGATTKAIARDAGVTEATLFRAFTSKEGLFEAAVLAPFEEFLSTFADRWLQAPVPGGTPEEVLPEFVRDLYGLVREHRDLFAAMTHSRLLGPRTRSALDRLESVGEAIARTQQPPFDVRVSVRAATAMVVSVAMQQDELFPAESGVGPERIILELTRMLIGAARYAPPAAAGKNVRLAR